MGLNVHTATPPGKMMFYSNKSFDQGFIEELVLSIDTLSIMNYLGAAYCSVAFHFYHILFIPSMRDNSSLSQDKPCIKKYNRLKIGHLKYHFSLLKSFHKGQVQLILIKCARSRD